MKPLETLGVTAVGVLAGVVGLGLFGAGQVSRSIRALAANNPEDWGFVPRNLTLLSGDGLSLSALYFESPSAEASIVVVHGHGGNKEWMLPVASMLHPTFHVLSIDLRAHGQSEGTRTSVGYHERQDVIAAVMAARGLAPGKVGVLGISMGAVAAILAAADDQGIDAVVADSGYDTLRGVVARAARLRGYPSPLTPFLASLTCRTLALQLRHPLRASDAVSAIGRIAPRPILILHGALDSLCSVGGAHRLYAAAGQPKDLWIAEDMEHAMAFQALPEEYSRRIQEFFQRWLVDRPARGD